MLLSVFILLYHLYFLATKFNRITFFNFKAFAVINLTVVFYFALSNNYLRFAAGLHQVSSFQQLYHGDVVTLYFKFDHGGPKINYSRDNELFALHFLILHHAQ